MGRRIVLLGMRRPGAQHGHRHDGHQQAAAATAAAMVAPPAPHPPAAVRCGWVRLVAGAATAYQGHTHGFHPTRHAAGSTCRWWGRHAAGYASCRLCILHQLHELWAARGAQVTSFLMVMLVPTDISAARVPAGALHPHRPLCVRAGEVGRRRGERRQNQVPCRRASQVSHRLVGQLWMCDEQAVALAVDQSMFTLHRCGHSTPTPWTCPAAHLAARSLGRHHGQECWGAVSHMPWSHADIGGMPHAMGKGHPLPAAGGTPS